MDLRCKCWQPSAEFSARTEGKGKILERGLVWRTFVDEGWIWQDIDVADYKPSASEFLHGYFPGRASP